jgi:hypothetical protein
MGMGLRVVVVSLYPHPSKTPTGTDAMRNETKGIAEIERKSELWTKSMYSTKTGVTCTRNSVWDTTSNSTH